MCFTTSVVSVDNSTNTGGEAVILVISAETEIGLVDSDKSGTDLKDWGKTFVLTDS